VNSQAKCQTGRAPPFLFQPPAHPLLSLLGGLLLAGTCLCSHADEAESAAEPDGPPPGWVGPPPGWSGGVLMGAARMPDYEGSRSSRNQPVLGAIFTYRSATWGSVEMGSRGLNLTMVQTPELSLGVGLSMDPGRIDNDDRKLTAVGYRPGNAQLAGMGTIDITPVLSAFGSAKVVGVPFTAALKHATASHEGTQLDLGLALPWKFARHAELSIAPSLTWADQRYMQAFFGVTDEQALASHRAVFETQASLKSAQLSLALDMALSRNWHFNANLQARRLVGDAAKSPLTEKTTQVGLQLAALYAFQL